MVLSRVRILVFAAAAGLILHFSVPPFHNPDEPQHFSLMVRLAWGDGHKDEIERGIIRMMDRARWWRTVGMGEPVELPRSFSEIRFISRSYKGDLKDLHRGLLLYHHGVAAAVGPLAGKSLERFYVLARAVSYALFLATLLVLYGAFQAAAAGVRKRREPEASAAAARGASLTIWEGAPLLFILFLPQALIIALSVGPDPWCIFLGAVFFRSAFAVVRGEAGAAALLGLFGATMIGALSDSSIFVFIPLAIVAALFAFKWKNLQRSVLMVLFFVVGILVFAFAVVQIFPHHVEKNFVFMTGMVKAALKTFGTGLGSAFLNSLVESFFLRFGWMGFGAPPAVVWGWKAACLAAAAGLGIYFVRNMIRRTRPAGSLLKIVGFAIVALGIQVALLRLATTSENVMYAQGRYLFPMLLPIAVLFVAGFREFFDVIERAAGGVLRVARSILGRGAGRAKLSEEGAKGSQLSGGVAGKEACGAGEGKEESGIEAGGLRASDGFAEPAVREGRKALSEEKVWAAPGDALMVQRPQPPRLGEWAVMAFLIAELLVLGYAVWALIIPAFHLTRSTPLPGI